MENSITIPQALIGALLTIVLTFGGSYLALRDGAVERQTRIEYLETENTNRKSEIKELKQEVKELRDTQVKDIKEILSIVGEIKAELKGKQNRKD